MNYVSAIVLAAGRGLRFSRSNNFMTKGGIPTQINKMRESGNPKTPKLLAKVGSYPIISYSLGLLSNHPQIKEITLVVNKDNLGAIKQMIRKYRIKKIKHIVLGGRLRQDSVRRGLEAINNYADLVLIHDGARPFIDKNTVSRVIKEAGRSGAAIVGMPVKATIKRVTRHTSHVTRKFTVEKTIDREDLWEIQTPQVFRKDLLLEAYRRFGDIEVTDDAMLVEKLGAKVSVVMGAYSNIKITTPEDLVLAEAILRTKQQIG